MRPDDYYFYNDGTATVERNDDKTDNVFIEILPSHRNYKEDLDEKVLQFNDEIVNDRFYKQTYKKGIIKDFNNKRLIKNKDEAMEDIAGYSYTVTNPDDAKKLFEISATNSVEEFARAQYRDPYNREISSIWTDGPRKSKYDNPTTDMYPIAEIHNNGNKIEKITHSHPFMKKRNGKIDKRSGFPSEQDETAEKELRGYIPNLKSQLFNPWYDGFLHKDFIKDYTDK